MALIDEYVNAVKNKEELFKKCLRTSPSGLIAVGPTNKGGNYLKYDGKDIDSNISIGILKQLRDTIDIYLKEVLENENTTENTRN